MNMSTKMRRILGVVFALYLAALVYVLLFSPYFGRTQETPHGVNLAPLTEIRRFWKGPESLGSSQFLINVVGNVLAFLPLGLLTALLLRRRYYGAFALAVTYLASLGAELLQYCLRVGSFDIDDVILNSVGGLLGILIAFIIREKHKNKKRTGHAA